MKPLTPKQRQTLSLAADGASYAEIAAALGIPALTVRERMKAIYRIYGVNRRTEAVLTAIERGDLLADNGSKTPTPTNIRMSQDGAVAVYEPKGPSRPRPWKVVHAAGDYMFLQRLMQQDVAGWEVLYNHNHQGAA
ncbi:response regulator transcription factor [Amycolatopsis kentuckyensis]|uniref:response regulator transcription factor n=1 Tax=Amycolatopsis kentuckyensis TaxID=218823 RepID=UPI000A35E742|nr:helix-turn-helix transcriptional regulator [Amycolatopsis kentuckyensis]